MNLIVGTLVKLAEFILTNLPFSAIDNSFDQHQIEVIKKLSELGTQIYLIVRKNPTRCEELIGT